MTPIPKRRRRWRAPSPDGIAHSFGPQSDPFALCGARNVPERWDWPRLVDCPRCLELEVSRERIAS